ncbi:K+-transporting ATPase, B subunit [Staphylococcus aureus H12818]|uniref:potassium-transporting ATPase subunit KdpB n=1 Tax=Staphylococcus aureus TaxID=1280 RepID=UPI000449F37C|nr:potassium-transporting ATPase subunit KdpB [Staphylococcus aureus]EVH89492.1 K+-transporting ATPase, B subunit [Staphylococcus aureus SCLE6032]EVV24654.1 K+-transporting ATPase, B subunit [Staphylococcus aureus H12818]
MAETTKIFESHLVKQALKDSVLKLYPVYMIKNPIMFVVEVGMLLALGLTIYPDLFHQESVSRLYVFSIFIILLLTLVFANFSEALAEGRGKAQANALRQTQTEMKARRIKQDGSYEMIDASDLKKGHIVRVATGEQIPNDGKVIKGLATVDESAITGESAPVIKESGGDFDNVIGGTSVASDWLEVEITSEPGHSFLDKMIGLVEGATRKKTPNEIALFTLLMTLTIIFLVVILTMYPLAKFLNFNLSIAMLIALAVCLIPTTIGGLLSAIGIAGMDRVTQFNILAKSGRSVETCGDVNVLILDKTGTITYGNRMADAFIPVKSSSFERLVKAAYESSIADDTPEGRSIVKLAYKQHIDLPQEVGEYIPFTAETRMSGVKFTTREVYKGAPNSMVKRVKEAGVDRFVAECKPEDKINVIREEQAKGHIVAMTGDGTNDAPALAEANVGLAMNSGTMSAKEAANLIDLDSNPTKLMEVVLIGKQLLMTRGSLTTFSIANDIAKYFAILPAMFMAAMPAMNHLNIMHLHSPESAVLSALIFNALIIVLLIPIAMKGVKFKGASTQTILMKNMLVYGLGGMIVPFIGIKLIDLIIQLFV